MPETCPTHPAVELVAFCPRCRAQAGGRVSNDKKRAASRENLAKARQIRLSKAREPG